MMPFKDRIQKMGLGFPDVGRLTDQLNEKFDQLIAKLDEILAELRTQRGAP